MSIFDQMYPRCQSLINVCVKKVYFQSTDDPFIMFTGLVNDV